MCKDFSYETISTETQKFLIQNGLYKENEYVKLENLRLCNVLYMGLDGNTHNGQLVVAYKIISPIDGSTVNVAKEVLEIFKEIYDAKYPIESIYPGTSSDDFSVMNNNTVSFNYRNIAGTNCLSWHALGLAIDINPFFIHA